MTTVLDRFLRYVQYDTQSDERSKSYPSTASQLVLLRDLASELRALGIADAAVDDYGYVMATIPPTTVKRGVPAIGFIAHVDTSPEIPAQTGLDWTTVSVLFKTIRNRLLPLSRPLGIGAFVTDAMN